MTDNLYILYESDHWDGPISGVGRYQGNMVWFDLNEEFQADPQTDQRLETHEILRRNTQVSDLFTQFRVASDSGNTEHEHQISDLIDQIEPITIRIYAIYSLTLLDKIRIWSHIKKFEIMVGNHWSWYKGGKSKHSFKINRWFGLGRVLFRIYYNTRWRFYQESKYHLIRKIKSTPAIAFVRSDQCQLGEPSSE